jgi:hypothetical protein
MGASNELCLRHSLNSFNSWLFLFLVGKNLRLRESGKGNGLGSRLDRLTSAPVSRRDAMSTRMAQQSKIV